MSDERTLHLDIDDRVSAVEALRQLVSGIDDTRMGNIVTDRFCRRLINELGGVVPTSEWLSRLVEDVASPILVHMPEDSSDGTVRLFAPSAWSTWQLQRWVARRWPDGLGILGSTREDRLRDESV